MPKSRWLSALAATALMASATALATDVTEITPDDFYGASYFETALEHPKVAKQKSESRKVALVARDLGWKKTKLRAALDKMRGLEGDPLELARTAVMTGFEGSRVEGRVLDVLFNASEPKHVVVYVRWRGSRSRDAVKEASTIAHIIAEKAPFVSTLSLAAIHPKSAVDSKTSVWEAKIGRTSMERIKPARIDGYADRLYARMFEDMKTRPF
ncbi:MAG: hypothetical protein AAFZ18_12015 [Myxococcota bacterium]